MFLASATKSDTPDNRSSAVLSIKIHKIEKIDEIESWLEGGADWYFKICVYDGKWHNTSNVGAPSDNDEPAIDRIFDFDVENEEVTICIKLMERDFWTNDDLADISSYPGGGKDNDITTDRGAIFVAHYSLKNDSLWGDEIGYLIEVSGNYTEYYYYTSGTMDGSSSIDENDACIYFQIWHTEEILNYNPNSRLLNVIQITDIHVDSSDTEIWQNLEEVIEAINEIKPDLVLVTGDLVDGATDENYQKFNELMDEILPNIEIEYVVGNHDIRVEGSPFTHSYMLYHYYINSQSDKILINKYYRSHGIVFLGLDSNDKPPIDNDYSGEIDSSQLEWLNEQLQQYNDAKQVIIFMHHPVFSDVEYLGEDSAISDNLTARDSFIDICEQPDENDYSKVSMVLAGHTHVNEVWEENGRNDYGHYPIIGKKLFPMERGYFNNFYDKRTKFIHTASVRDNKTYRLIQLCGENAVYRIYNASCKNPLPHIKNITIYPAPVVNQGEKIFIYAQVNGGKSGVKKVKCFWSADKMNWQSLYMEEIDNGIYKTKTPVDTSTIPCGKKVFCKIVVENRDNYLATNETNFSINIPPLANFSWNPLNPKISDAIQFIDASYDEDGLITNYTWDFGDGNISYKKNPIYVYSNPGVYIVTLTVTDDAGSITNISKEIMIYLPPLPGKEHFPTDQDNDGLYEDINGNGLIDFDDVVEFFQHFDYIEENWPTETVDFNGNGLTDFDDIVELFMQ